MYPNVLLDLIGQYLDLGSYKQIIDIYPKIFNVEKYFKYQIKYEKIFADEINVQYNELLSPIFELIQKDGTQKIKYIFIKHHYLTVQKIIYALEYCDIFISQYKNTEIIILDLERNIFNKCNLTGKIIRQFNNLISIYDNVNISYKIHSHNLFINFKSGHYELENKYLSKLYLLYVNIMSKFYKSNNFISIYHDNQTNYEEEYEAFIDLINYRKMKFKYI